MYRASVFVTVFVLLILDHGTQSAQQHYPLEDNGRLDEINELFQHELVKAAMKSLDDILALVNVSTALDNMQKSLITQNKKYEEVTMEARDLLTELQVCKFEVSQSWDSCLDCAVLCGALFETCSEGSIQTLQDHLISKKEAADLTDVKVYKIDVSFEEIKAGLEFIDRIHKEVNKISAFLLQLLSQLTPAIQADTEMTAHMMTKLNFSATEIADLFKSLKLLEPEERKKFDFDDEEVKEARERVKKLLSTIGGTESDLIDEDELTSLVNIPEKRKPEASVWEKVIESVEEFWDSTKDVSGKVWGKTKDVASSGFCSVKSVFFDSDCDDKRKRREIMLPECTQKEMLSTLDTECQNLPSCSACSSFRDEKSPSKCSKTNFDSSKESYDEIILEVMRYESEFKQSLKTADAERVALLDTTYETFKNNLWIIPMSYNFQKDQNLFKIEDMIYDPKDFEQKDGQVFYKGVQIQMSKSISEVFDYWIPLEPFDVHNTTTTAKVSSEGFLKFFKELDIVQESVTSLLKGINIWEF